MQQPSKPSKPSNQSDPRKRQNKQKETAVTIARSPALPPLVQTIPWNPNECFLLKDKWLKNGAAYALYRIPPELAALIRVTTRRTLIATVEAYERYLPELVLISEIPPAVLVSELMDMCRILVDFIFMEETDFKANPRHIALLKGCEAEIRWLADTLVPFFREGIISMKEWPDALRDLDLCLKTLGIGYEFGDYTAFGYVDPLRCESR